MKINFLLFLFISLYANSQVVEPIKWSFDSKQNGKEAELIFKASIDENWHLYDTELKGDGPIATSIVFDDSTLFDFTGKLIKNPEPETHFDSLFSMNVGFFSHHAELKYHVTLKTDKPVVIKGHVLFMGCNNETCLTPSEANFSFNLNASGEKQDTAVAGNSPGNGQGKSLWLFLIIAAVAGLAAVLTPCVFPMIPMTVSFFMRGSENKSRGIRNGLFFGASIVFIYTLLGALFSFGVFGPNVGNILSTHWVPNLLFFLLFLVFSLSFFGAFEIILPSSLVNKTDSQADKGGLVGAFFMALTTVIVSFSCTGPFIGALIIEAVRGGGLRPLLGMFAFGLAFATPFTLLAIFPSSMSKLPKSGAWLNAIKVVFAFILLAFSLKFLSNIDQVYGLGLLSRELYLSFWIVVFFLLGLYLLGKIKFSHDSDLPYLGVGRFLFATLIFVFSVYLFTGFLGNPLSEISSLLPPPSSNTVHSQSAAVTNSTGSNQLCGPAKYADKLHLPQGLQGYYEFEQGIACAREQNKPALVVFKGHACANCKKMENTVWQNPELLKLLSEKYVVIGLYTDDRTTLPENEWVTRDGNVLKTMGKKNLDILISKYNTNTIPFHAIIKPDGSETTLDVTFDNDEFFNFISKGVN